MTSIMQSRHSEERRQKAATEAFLRRLDNAKACPEFFPEPAEETIAAARAYRSGGMRRFIAKAGRWLTKPLARFGAIGVYRSGRGGAVGGGRLTGAQ